MADGAEEELLVGVEEEFLLVDSESGRPAPRIGRVIDDATELAGEQAQQELHRAQIESASQPHSSLQELEKELIELRQKLVEAAANHGCSVVASATYPKEMGEQGRLITRKDRYEEMAEANKIIALEQLICGCHVHVSTPDSEQAIHTMNRIRRWLPCLLALSSNSPYWEGRDSGFASYRSEVWSRWPTAGPPGEFHSAAEYKALVSALIDADVILDEGMAYWDVRPSNRYPTLEIRISDVMPTPENVIAVAGLTRALVGTCSSPRSSTESLRPELLKAACWQAAQSGLSGGLIDPADGSVRPARRAIDDLFDFVGRELEARGDLVKTRRSVDILFSEGTGASLQRRAFVRRNRMSDVLEAVTLGPAGRPVLA